MKKRELYDLRAAIIACDNLEGAKFCYGLAKNLDSINSEIKLIEAARHKPSEKLEKYTEEEKELVKSHAKKNEKGDFILENNFYTFSDIHALNDVLTKLKEKHPEAIEEIKKAEEDFNKLLDEEADFKPYLIKCENVDPKIKSKEFRAIKVLITEE